MKTFKEWLYDSLIERGWLPDEAKDYVDRAMEYVTLYQKYMSEVFQNMGEAHE